MSEKEIMSEESMNELINGFEIVGSLTEYGRKNIKYHFQRLQEENQELKKQLENCYCNRTDCSGRIKDSKQYDSLVQRVENQQKDFISYLENEKDRLIHETSHYYTDSFDRQHAVNETIYDEVDKNFFGTTAIYIKSSETTQEKYCIEDDKVVEQAKELIGKEVKVEYGTRVGLYSTGRCSSAPIEKIEKLNKEN